jgi:hypothetical protein
MNPAGDVWPGLSQSGLVSGRWRVQRFLHRELAAGALEEALHGARVHKLKSEAKSVPMPDKSKNFYFAKRNRELEPYNLADRNFLSHHRRNSGFADIDRMASDNGRISWINTDIHLQAKTRVNPRLGELRFSDWCQAGLYSQMDASSGRHFE